MRTAIARPSARNDAGLRQAARFSRRVARVNDIRLVLGHCDGSNIQLYLCFQPT